MSNTLQVDGGSAEVDIEEQTEPPMSSTEKLKRKLWAVAAATFAVDIGAGLHRPGGDSVFGGHKVAYYGVLAAVAVEMATAFWLPRSHGHRLLAFSKGLLPCAVVVLLVVLAMGGVALTVKQA